jgi:hypothetical protein
LFFKPVDVIAFAGEVCARLNFACSVVAGRGCNPDSCAASRLYPVEHRPQLPLGAEVHRCAAARDEKRPRICAEVQPAAVANSSVQSQRLAKPFACRLDRLQQLHPQLVLEDRDKTALIFRPHAPDKFGYRRG